MCGSECERNEDYDNQYYCENCGLVLDEEPLEPNTAARSFRETYIEAWHEHQRLHRR